MILTNITTQEAFKFYTILISVIGTFLLFTVLTNQRFYNRFFKPNKSTGNFYFVMFQKLSGVVLFGIVQVLIVKFFIKSDLYQYGFVFPKADYFLFIIFLSVIGLIVISYFNSLNPNHLKMYPQIRNHVWNKKIFLMNILTWALYLFAYELMFRGLLLFVIFNYLGYFYAIAINTIIYSIYHFPKGFKESIAAVPFGIFLCYISIETNSFFYAWILHFTLALSNDLFSFKSNPEMNMKSKKSY